MDTVRRLFRGSAFVLLTACGPVAGSDGGGSNGHGSSDGDDATGGTTVEPTGADDGSGTEDPPQACTPGGTRICYDGPPATQGVGACMAGEQACLDDGATWSECVGATLPEVDQCITPADEDCDGTIGCVPSLVWQIDLAGQTDAIVTDTDGNIYVGGYGIADATYEGQEIEDLFILSLTPDGALRWVHNVEELDDQHFTRLIANAQGMITGIGLYRNSPDFGDGPLPPTGVERPFIVRYDGDGTLQWSRALDLQLPNVAVADDGSTVLVGHSAMQTLDGVPLTDDFYIASLDAAGTLSWARFGVGLQEYFSDLRAVVRPDGTIVVVGRADYAGLVSLDGVELDVPPEGIIATWSLDPAGNVVAGEVLGTDSMVELDLVDVGLAGDEVIVSLLRSFEMPAETYHNELRRLRVDSSLTVRGEWTTGTRVFPQGVFSLPEGRTLLHADVVGPQQFGTGVFELQPDESTLLLVDLDDAGQGRWAARYGVSGNGPIYAGPGPVTADPTGAILVTGYLWDGPSSVLEQPIDGGFIIKVMP